MLQSQSFSSASFLPFFMLLSLIPFATPKPDGFSLDLIHMYSPQSPFYPGNLTESERISRLVESSKIRAHNLDSHLKYNSSALGPESYRFHLSLDRFLYMVRVRIGTPGIPLYLLLDTGSHLTWTQCEPCTHRYNQQPPIFNSRASQTYRKIPCQDPFCRNNRDVFQCVNNDCVYRERYGSGDANVGVASTEVLESANNQRLSLNFGCSKDNRNFNAFARTGMIGGIMGLNMSPVSLLQQLRNVTGQRFSYCLNPIFLAPRATSILKFGSDFSRWGRYSSTPFVSPPDMPNYFLNLLDISVAGHRLRLPPEIFALRRDGTGGTIIDSGTALTMIVQPAYRNVISAFQNHFDHLGFHRVHIPDSELDLCYNFQRNRTFQNHASLTFHFQGADFTVEPSYVYAIYNTHDAFCVGILVSRIEGRTIIGALHQGNTRFIYNAAKRKLKFKAENCEHDSTK